jgi:hypothetical protein
MPFLALIYSVLKMTIAEVILISLVLHMRSRTQRGQVIVQSHADR